MVNLGWMVAFPVKLRLLSWQEPDVTELSCLSWASREESFSLGWFAEWRSEPQFWVLIPEEKRASKRKQVPEGHTQEGKISPGLALDPAWRFWWLVIVLVTDDARGDVSLCDWRLHEGAGMGSFEKAVPQLCSKANVEGEMPLEWASKHQKWSDMESLGCVRSNMLLGCMGISGACE